MAYWNHRFVKVIVDIVGTEIGLYEVYYDDDDRPVSRTESPATFVGDTEEEAFNALIRANRAISLPVLDDSDIGKQETDDTKRWQPASDFISRVIQEDGLSSDDTE